MQRPPRTLHRQPSEWDQIDFCHSQYLYWGSSKDVRYKSVDRVARVGMNLTLLKGKRIWRMQGIHGRILVLAFSEKALTYFEEFSLRSEAVARVGMTRTLPNGRFSLSLCLSMTLSLSLACDLFLSGPSYCGGFLETLTPLPQSDRPGASSGRLATSYSDTSLIRKHTPLGPYRRPTSKVV